MSKLTKREIQLHDQAVCLLQKEHLSHEDKLFIFLSLKISGKTRSTSIASPVHFLLLLDLPTILLSRFRAYTERRSELSTCVLESAY